MILASLLILSALSITGARQAPDPMTVIRPADPDLQLQTTERMVAQFRYAIQRVIWTLFVVWIAFTTGLMLLLGVVSAIATRLGTRQDAKRVPSMGQAGVETSPSPSGRAEALLEPAQKNA